MFSGTSLRKLTPKLTASLSPVSGFLMAWTVSTLVGAAATVAVFSYADRWVGSGFFALWPGRLYTALWVSAMVAVPFGGSVACRRYAHSGEQWRSSAAKLMMVMDRSADFLTVWVGFSMLFTAANFVIFSSYDRWWRGFGFLDLWPERLFQALLVAALVAIPVAGAFACGGPAGGAAPRRS